MTSPFSRKHRLIKLYMVLSEDRKIKTVDIVQLTDTNQKFLILNKNVDSGCSIGKRCKSEWDRKVAAFLNQNSNSMTFLSPVIIT